MRMRMNMDDYTKDQLQEIEEGKQAGVDVSVYEFQKRMPLLPAGRKKYSRLTTLYLRNDANTNTIRIYRNGN